VIDVKKAGLVTPSVNPVNVPLKDPLPEKASVMLIVASAHVK